MAQQRETGCEVDRGAAAAPAWRGVWRRAFTVRAAAVCVAAALAAVVAGAVALGALETWPEEHAAGDPADAADAGGPGAVTVSDSLGRVVTLRKRPERVAALAPHAAELLAALGVEPALRPSTAHEWSPAVRDVPTISVEHAAGPNLEQLAQAAPDLVVTTSTFAQFIPAMEAATGEPALVLDVRSVADLVEAIATLGELVGKSERADALIADIETTAEAAAPADASRAPRVFALFGSPSAFYAFLPDTYLGDLVEIAGGDLVEAGRSRDSRYKGLAPVGLETIVAAEPDVILVVAHSGAEANLTSLRADPVWSNLRAVREGRVFSLPERLFVTAAGVRFGQAVEMVREALMRSDAIQ